MSDGTLKHLLEVNDLTVDEIEKIFFRAAEFKEKGFSSSVFYQRDPSNVPIVALAFFEPSTRTRLSFDASAQRIGLKTIGFDNPATTSSAKGEQLEDTIKVIEKYADAIVIRRKDHDTPDIVKKVATKPVISAGVGSQEHPTQALLDVFTIKERRDLEGIRHIVSYGDLANSRTMISQVRLLIRLLGGNSLTFTFVAPDQMQASSEFIHEVENAGAQVNILKRLDDVVSEADVLHIIRPQKERWDTDPKEIYSAVTEETFSNLKSDALVLHALPRTGELSPETDNDPHSIVFDQVVNGIFVRAALLEWLTNI